MNSIKKNYFYNVIYEVLVIVIPLITSPYISRVLGPDGIGVYTFRFSVANYFLLFARLGIQNYGTRSIAGAKTQVEKDTIFSSILFLQIILAVTTMLIYGVYTFFVPDNQRALAYLMMSYLVSSVFDVTWFFFGIEQFKITISRNIVIKVLSTLLIFILVRHKEDLFKYASILAAGNFIGQIALLPYLHGRVKITKIKAKTVLCVAKPIVILFIPQIAVSLYKMMDKIMVGSMCIKSQLAYYEYASMIVGLPLGFITSLGTIMLPRTAALLRDGQEEKSKEYMYYSMLFSVGLSFAFSFGISGISPVFVPFYFGSDFSPTSKLLIGLSISLPFISWANVIRTQYLIPKKHDKEYIISLFCGAIANIIFNVLLIPKLEAFGAVIGTIVAEVVVCLVQTFFVQKAISLRKMFEGSMGFCGIGIIMILIISIIPKFGFSEIITLLLQVIIGMLLYMGFSIIYLRFVLRIDLKQLKR